MDRNSTLKTLPSPEITIEEKECSDIYFCSSEQCAANIDPNYFPKSFFISSKPVSIIEIKDKK